MGKLFRTLAICLLVLGVAFCFTLDAYAAKVALVVYADNPDYKNARDTFEKELKAAGTANKIPIEYVVVNTKGDKEAFIAECQRIEKDVDLFFVSGTPNAMALKASGVQKPVIFSAVASALGAKLVESLNAPGTNFTGTYCAVPEERQLGALLLALPKVKKIGVLYNPSDPAPTAQAKGWKKAIEDRGLQMVEFFIPATTASADDLAEATKPMVGKVDVIVTTADAKVSPYADGMIKIANVNGIPTYASLTSLVNKGALVSLGFDFAEGARLSIPQALDILKGKSPAVIPVVTYPQYKLVLNLKTAKELGIDFTLEAVKTASEVIKE